MLTNLPVAAGLLPRYRLKAALVVSTGRPTIWLVAYSQGASSTAAPAMKHRPAVKPGAKRPRVRQSISSAAATPRQSSNAEPPVINAAPHNRPATAAATIGRWSRAIAIALRAIPSSNGVVRFSFASIVAFHSPGNQSA